MKAIALSDLSKSNTDKGFRHFALCIDPYSKPKIMIYSYK